MLRNQLKPIFLGMSLIAMAATVNADGNHPSVSRSALNIAVFGDSPYGTSPTDTAEFEATPAFIDAINADTEVSLVLNVGDIHSGKQYCTEDYNRSIYSLWTTFKSPVIYTPGDNEWTDCHKSKEGGGTYNAVTGQIDYKVDSLGNPISYASGNPVENLNLIRSIFFAKPGMAIGGQGRGKFVLSQAFSGLLPSAIASDSKYAENVLWLQSNVLFVTLNIPGGSNNDADIWYGAPTMSDQQTQEVAERTGADLRWLDTAFSAADLAHARAVVIQLQADMWDLDGNTASHIANYKQFIDSIASHAKTFGKPVLLLNGDSHGYRSDNPLVQGAPCANETGSTCSDDAYANQPNGYNVPNFHRIVVHGSVTPLEWLKLTVDPKANNTASANAFGPFSWQRMTQP